eukprot:TRINITY_DN11371_c0_g1_i1.p1 TRINITY_DN11371_c0_g1~~TRINITY_DN11371_c0_g1_i1.p1  ORF type:complete len:302 (-),score=86.31 TRINITY_DN11371_c0_g1_i1:516-1421(-)
MAAACEPQWNADRAAAAVLGGLVADAAAQTTHWRYDVPAFHEALQQAEALEAPEFAWPALNTSYSLPRGAFSCYGDQAMTILESLVATQGQFSPEDAMARLVRVFGEDSVYGPLERAQELPLDGPWRHNSLKQMLVGVNEGLGYPECGARDPFGSGGDSQADCVVRIIPVVALYAGKPDMLERVAAAVSTTQNNPKALAHAAAAAQILEACILGHAPAAAVRAVVPVLAQQPQADALEAQLSASPPAERAALRQQLLSELPSQQVRVHIETAVSVHHASPGAPFHELAAQAVHGAPAGGLS